MASGYNVRIGDADREAIAAQLREHFADGRLTLEELNERLDQTFAAKTRADLSVVMRDLPHVARPMTGAPAWPGPAGSTGWNQTGWDRSGWNRSGWDGANGAGRPASAVLPSRRCWRWCGCPGSQRGDAVRHRRRPAAGHRLDPGRLRVPQAADRLGRARPGPRGPAWPAGSAPGPADARSQVTLDRRSRWLAGDARSDVGSNRPVAGTVTAIPACDVDYWLPRVSSWATPIYRGIQVVGSANPETHDEAIRRPNGNARTRSRRGAAA